MNSFKKGFFILSVLLILAGTIGCCPVLRKEVVKPKEGVVQVHSLPMAQDDMEKESMILALGRNIEYLDRLDPKGVVHYGADDITVRQVRESQELFLDLLSKNLDADQLSEVIGKRFLVYKATGRGEAGKVLFTGYFEPVYEGSLTPDEIFKYPLYHMPDDLIKIDLSSFNEKFKGEQIVARIEENKVLPYYTRYQIEDENALAGRGLEFAWLKDPLDVFFLQIQGSGRLRLSDGKEIAVHYQASNGRPYRSIGGYMIEKGFLTLEEMSMQAMRKYLTENPEVLDETLNTNPSYVFFQQVEKGPLGNIGVILTPGRSIALDTKVFPKGALGFIKCQKPVINDQGEITGWVEFSRFVVNQDTGGAIKGAGRADIFWGSGPYAEIAAGYLHHEGELYLLIMKDSTD